MVVTLIIIALLGFCLFMLLGHWLLILCGYAIVMTIVSVVLQLQSGKTMDEVR